MSRSHEFVHYCPCAGSVELVGDFLAGPVAMRSDSRGWWRTEQRLPGRDCRYFYLIDGAYSTPDYACGEPEYAQDGTLVSILRHRGGDLPAPRERSGAGSREATGV